MKGREERERGERAEIPPLGLSDGLGFCAAIGSKRAEITQQT